MILNDNMRAAPNQGIILCVGGRPDELTYEYDGNGKLLQYKREKK